MKEFRCILLMIILALANIIYAQTFSHSIGQTSINEKGMQDCHEQLLIIYANSGENITFYRPAHSTFKGYVRWYNYETDARLIGLNGNGYTYNYTTNDGVFTAGSVDRNEMSLTFSGTRTVVGCDQSGYKDYTFNSSNIIEPTLSQRAIYDVRPASEIANRISTCTGEHWLEVHNMIAPTINNLYIGPDYPFLNSTISTSVTSYVTHCNYYYPINGGYKQMTTANGGTSQFGPDTTIYTVTTNLNVSRTFTNQTEATNFGKNGTTSYTIIKSTKKWYKSTGSGWIWKVNGVQATYSAVTGQFIGVKSNIAGENVYTLQYNAGGSIYSVTSHETRKYAKNKRGTWAQSGTTMTTTETGQTIVSEGSLYNIAKFNITYYNKTDIGPVENISNNDVTDMNLIAGNDFNYNMPGTSTKTYYDTAFNADESSYGYYYNSLSAKHIMYTDPYWSEYCIVNNSKQWATKEIIYQHNDSISGAEAGKLGYMIYCDGSEKPGNVFKLSMNADLCPGSRMYFSAWVCDLSSNNSGDVAPNLDFIVVGVDDLGKEDILTTYTTGEFGGNAYDRFGKWMQIFFPLEFENVDYSTYKLMVTNKGTDGGGNDFVIDDIKIYVQKPPVTPIQASTYDCPTSDTTTITTYLRVDYQSIENVNNAIYYQWQDNNEHIMTTTYIGGGNTHGVISIPASDAQIIASGDTCSSLLSFDTRYHNTDHPVVKYIKEPAAGGERYIMYIAQPLLLKTNYTYTGFISNRLEDLGSKEGCGTYADLLIAGGTRITINDDNVTDTVSDICGNRSYNLGIIMAFIVQNETTGMLEEQITTCRADWLYGDSVYVNNHFDQYHAKFYEIEEALIANRADTATDIQNALIDYLVGAGLLQRNSATLDVQPIFIGGSAVAYTAFPIAGSASNGMQICTAPRFLSIEPQAIQSNYVVIGHEGETLPEYVAANPRRIRVSNKSKNLGEFGANMYLIGDKNKEYIIDKAIVINSTYPGWETAYENFAIYPKSYNRISHTLSDTITSDYDSIVFKGNDMKTLVAGYDYTLYIHMKNSTEDCSMGYTYCIIRVVPDVVTWKAGSTSWNNDGSWIGFVPMSETDVIFETDDYIVPEKTILLDSSQLLLLEEDAQYYISYDFNYVPFSCNNIYLPDGTVLAHQERLDINGQAYIDIKQTPNQWQMRAFPIQGIVTGDIFTPVNESSSPFIINNINQTVGTNAIDRTTYPYYYSKFNATTQNVENSTKYTSSTWTMTTNNMSYSIEPGSGIMIGLDYDGLDEPIIKLPKKDTIYNYYQYGQWVSSYETRIERSTTYGKPAYAEDMNITLTGNSSSNVFLFGNPTFAAIDITKLIEANSDILSGAYYSSGLGVQNRYDHIQCVNSISADGANHSILKPCQAILLETKEYTNSITLNIPTSIMCISNGDIRKSRKAILDKQIFLKASSNTYSSYATMVEDENASNNYIAGEDVKLFLMPKGQTPFAIYTYTSDTALSINQFNSEDFIYIGYINQKKVNNIVLEITGDDNYMYEWDLIDLNSNESYPLYNGIMINNLEIGNYALYHARKNSNFIATDINDIENMSSTNILIYDLSGKILNTSFDNLPRGIYIIKAGQNIRKVVR